VKLLLDTHVFLWWIAGDERVSARAARAIGDGRAEVFVSAASLWEIAIKARLGRLRIDGDPARFLSGQLRENAFQGLPVGASHALRVWALPDLHRDPFDRMLVAQAQAEGLKIVTADREIARYAVETVW
jgi:PIN domain nuclease of toxin-antitoxin system